MAAKIVAAEREVPGKMPAIDLRDADQDRHRQVTAVRSGWRAASRSAASIQKPPITSAQATGVTVSGSLKPSFTAMKPSTAVMRERDRSASSR